MENNKIIKLNHRLLFDIYVIFEMFRIIKQIYKRP